MSNLYARAAEEILGKPWDEEKFHCYDCVRYISLHGGDILLPEQHTTGKNIRRNNSLMSAQEATKNWIKIDIPNLICPGDVVSMGSERIAYHLGIVTSREYGKIYVTHCSEKTSGVVTMEYRDIERYGWHIHGFYRYKGCLQ